MSAFEIALLLHLAGAIAWFAGLALAAAAFLAGRRRQRPSEIAAVLALARTGVLVVAAGTALVVGFGAWLVELTGHGYGDAWLSAALALLVASLAIGGAAGQAPKRARRLAAELAARDDRRTPELERLLGDRASLALNVLVALASVAILVLMVWRPGSP